MKIIHSIKNLKANKNTPDTEDIGFLLTNKNGSFINMFPRVISRYNGFFINNNQDIFKIIESIDLLHTPQVDTTTNYQSYVERKRGTIVERFIVPENKNSLIYELNKKQDISIVFDIRKIFDNSEWGKIYDVLEKGSMTIIRFRKQKSKKKEYELFVAIKSDTDNVHHSSNWFERFYSEDKIRNDTFKQHVHRLLTIHCSRIVISVNKQRKKAESECNLLFNKSPKRSISNIVSVKGMSNKDSLTYNCAVNSLNDLFIKKENNFFAGYPWFTQFWTRDTLISIKALMLIGDYQSAKDILLNYLSSIMDDGRIPNRSPSSDLGTADGIGWLFKRVYDFVHLPSDNMYDSIVSEKDETKIVDAMEHAVDRLLSKHTKDGLAYNKKLETWMDTDFGNDARQGARIEIQALRLNMYHVLYSMTGKKVYLELENDLRKAVRSKFWKDNVLADGVDDPTIRPNVFIAAYVYPQLLSKDEWVKCFENILPKLWLDWGGLSTIDNSHHLFCENYTGCNNNSYHRGDSWFWVNNLAAIVLHRTEKTKFKDYIKKIVNASSEEILFKGFISHHSEISSASSLSSYGCKAQLWSNAMFIELMHELYCKN